MRLLYLWIYHKCIRDDLLGGSALSDNCYAIRQVSIKHKDMLFCNIYLSHIRYNTFVLCVDRA